MEYGKATVLNELHKMFLFSFSLSVIVFLFGRGSNGTCFAHRFVLHLRIDYCRCCCIMMGGMPSLCRLVFHVSFTEYSHTTYCAISKPSIACCSLSLQETSGIFYLKQRVVMRLQHESIIHLLITSLQNRNKVLQFNGV